MRVILSLLLLFVFNGASIQAQQLKPGFDPDEYIGVLQRSAMQVDVPYRGEMPKITDFKRVYRSPEMGLRNRFEIWENSAKTIITVNLRGTTSDPDSWMENFYSAMIPAVGSLKLTDSFTFQYKFAEDPKAAVHVGWATGIASLAPDIIDKIMHYYHQGVKQLIVEGHSQGGALAFLLSSYLHYQQAETKLPHDLVIKTYCSAGPKPGNQHYAYDFDFINRGGWGFNVVSELDWVPETPFSVQTLKDLNNINPFRNAHDGLRKQKLLTRLYTTHVYNQINKSTKKANRKYEKYLGKMMYQQIRKYMPQFEQPEYAHSFNYTRAGSPVILQPDSEYYKRFPDTGAYIFRHHLFEPYYFLVKKIYK